MATLPTYNGPQVRQRPLQAPSLSADAFGARAGGAVARMGENLNRVMGQVQQARQQFQERKDAASAFEAETRMQADWAEFSSGLSQRQGNQAEGIVEDGAKWWREAQAKYEDGLSPAARQILSKSAMRTRLSGMGGLLNHQNRELEKAHDASWEASKAMVVSAATKDPTDDNIAATLEVLREKNTYQARRKGWGADVLKQVDETDITKLHENVIDGLLNQEHGGLAAEKYFEKYKEQIAGTRHDEITKTIQRAAIDDNADLIAARLDNLAPSQALQHIQGIEDSRLRKAVKREWSTNNNIKQQIKNAAQSEAKDAVWRAINAGRRPTAGQMAGLSPYEYQRVQSYFDARATGAASPKTGLIHAKHSNYDAVRGVERMIESGDINNREALEEYAPYLTAGDYTKALTQLEKQGTVNLSNARTLFARYSGVTSTKIESKHRAEWERFKDYLYSEVQEKGRAGQLEEYTKNYFAEGYATDKGGWRDFVPFISGTRKTYGEALADGDLDNFNLKTPEWATESTRGALAISDRLLEGTEGFTSSRSDNRGLDDFYTQHVHGATQQLQAWDIPVNAATLGAVTALERMNRKVTPANVTNVLMQLQEQQDND